MTQRIAHSISLFLCQKGEIEIEDIDIYEYGFEVLLDAVLEIGLLIIIGCILGKGIFTVYFISTFVILRSFTGGYHAKTKIKCMTFTLAIYLVNLLLAYMWLDVWIYIVIAIVGSYIIWIYAPIQHGNKALSEIVKKRNRGISRGLVVMMLFEILILNKWMPIISNMLAITLIEVAILIIMGRRRRYA